MTATSTGPCGEQRFIGRDRFAPEARTKHGHSCPCQWDAALLSALPVAADIGRRAELGVTAIEADQFGEAQAGLDGQEYQGPVAGGPPSGPGRGQRTGLSPPRGSKTTPLSCRSVSEDIASTWCISSACSGCRRAA